jgi:hypothetical protein
MVMFRIFVSSGDDLLEPRDLVDDLALPAALNSRAGFYRCGQWLDRTSTSPSGG